MLVIVAGSAPVSHEQANDALKGKLKMFALWLTKGRGSKRFQVSSLLFCAAGKKDVLGREFSLLSFDPLAPTFIFDHSPELREHLKAADLGAAAFQRPLPNTWLVRGCLEQLQKTICLHVTLPF